MNNEFEKYSYMIIQGLESKCVLLRSCLNVTTDQYGAMLDSTRLEEALPMIKTLAVKAKSLVICGHLGRPKAKESNLSFASNIYPALKDELESMGFSLVFIKEVSQLPEKNLRPNKTVYLLENIRFDPREESRNEQDQINLAGELSEKVDIFINDAFADYRPSASTYQIAKFLPSFLGEVFLKEVQALSKFHNPPKPYVAILGGAKLSEKLDLLLSLAEKTDKILVGGAMAYTILKAKGVEIGNSLFEADKVEMAKEMLYKYAEKLILPVDHLVAADFTEEAVASAMTTQGEAIQEGTIAVDLGPKTIDLYKNIISDAASILWNGPMGVYEWEKSAVGTKEIGLAINNNQKAFKLAGGGDSITAINNFGIKNIDRICTGGGAMLAYLSDDKFPTLDIILNQKNIYSGKL